MVRPLQLALDLHDLICVYVCDVALCFFFAGLNPMSTALEGSKWARRYRPMYSSGLALINLGLFEYHKESNCYHVVSFGKRS